MGKRRKPPRVEQRPPRRPRWARATFGGLALLAVSGVALWWLWGAWGAFGRTPRLVVDRTEVDLGPLAFETPATAVFTLANAGDGLLKLVEEPPVKVLEGC